MARGKRQGEKDTLSKEHGQALSGLEAIEDPYRMLWKRKVNRGGIRG